MTGYTINTSLSNFKGYLESETSLLKEIGIKEIDIKKGLKRLVPESIDNAEVDLSETIKALKDFQLILCRSYLLSKQGERSINSPEFFKIIVDGLFDVIVIAVDIPGLKTPVTYFPSIVSIFSGTKSLTKNINDARWKFEVINTNKKTSQIKIEAKKIPKLKKHKDKKPKKN